LNAPAIRSADEAIWPRLLLREACTSWASGESKVCPSLEGTLALVEAKVALVMLLQRFSFGLSPSYTHAPFSVSTVQPEHGAQIVVKKI
jgi:hypothetical protein